MNSAAIANENQIAATVTTENGVTTYRNIKSRDYKRAGRVIEGTAARGQHAAVKPGESITLWGVDRNCASRFRPYRIEFKIGDSAEYDSYNLSYVGEIVAIGAKTVSIKHNHSSKVTRLTISEFNWRNNDFNAAAIHARNSEMMVTL